MDILDHLLEIGFRFHQLSIKENEQIINIIAIIAQAMLERDDKYGYASIRVLIKSIYLCVLSNDEKLNSGFVIHVRKFLDSYEQKFPQRKDIFFEELSRMKRDLIEEDCRADRFKSESYQARNLCGDYFYEPLNDSLDADCTALLVV